MAINGVTEYAGAYKAKDVEEYINHSGKLNPATQNYLNELKEKYPSVNISVVDFKSDKQKLSYMMGSTGLQNVAISEKILEKMANDPAMAAKYESRIAELPNDAKETQKFADDHNINIYGSGMIIDKDGKVTYWAVAGDKEERENPGSAYKNRVQKQIEEKRSEKKKNQAIEKRRAEAKKIEESIKERRVFNGNSKDELIGMMRHISSKNYQGHINNEKPQESGKGIKVDTTV